MKFKAPKLCALCVWQFKSKDLKRHPWQVSTIMTVSHKPIKYSSYSPLFILITFLEYQFMSLFFPEITILLCFWWALKNDYVLYVSLFILYYIFLLDLGSALSYLYSSLYASLHTNDALPLHYFYKSCKAPLVISNKLLCLSVLFSRAHKLSLTLFIFLWSMYIKEPYWFPLAGLIPTQLDRY